MLSDESGVVYYTHATARGLVAAAGGEELLIGFTYLLLAVFCYSLTLTLPVFFSWQAILPVHGNRK